jgi:hypothetical protein
MFGFFRFKASLKLSINAIADVLAPVRMLAQMQSLTLPNALFGDAYVLGFFQAYLTYVMNLGRKKPVEAREHVMIFQAAMDHYVQGAGEKLGDIVADVMSDEHPYHQHFMTGYRDGQMYVDVLRSLKFQGDMSPNGIPPIVPGLHDFTQFLKKNYLGKTLSADGSSLS